MRLRILVGCSHPVVPREARADGTAVEIRHEAGWCGEIADEHALALIEMGAAIATNDEDREGVTNADEVAR